MPYSIAQWEHDTLSAHIDGGAPLWPPVYTDKEGRYHDTTTHRFVSEEKALALLDDWREETENPEAGEYSLWKHLNRKAIK